jgi:hypothetical protein
MFLVPWFGALVVLLVWYPVRFTGEWVEMIAGFLFLVSAPTTGLALGGVVALAGAAVMTVITSARTGAANDVRLACARAEVPALLRDVIDGAATPQIVAVSALEKRFWTAANEGYLHPERLSGFRAAQCGRTSLDRREFLVDPWGLAYWLEVQDANGEAQLVVYSFGPNRRRGGGDDVRATATVGYDRLTN